jgi:hypothetical protein
MTPMVDSKAANPITCPTDGSAEFTKLLEQRRSRYCDIKLSVGSNDPSHDIVAGTDLVEELR